MAHLQLGNHELVTSPQRDAFVALQRKYTDIGQRHRSQFLSGAHAFQTIEDFLQAFATAVDHGLREISQAATDDVAANRVFHIGSETITADLSARAKGIRQGVDRIHRRYLEITEETVRHGEQRAAGKGSGGGIIGGGFGLEGAAKGILIATAAMP